MSTACPDLLHKLSCLALVYRSDVSVDFLGVRQCVLEVTGSLLASGQLLERKHQLVLVVARLADPHAAVGGSQGFLHPACQAETSGLYQRRGGALSCLHDDVHLARELCHDLQRFLRVA